MHIEYNKYKYAIAIWPIKIDGIKVWQAKRIGFA